MRELWQLYGCYVSASIRSQLQHRASTLMMWLGQLVSTCVEFGTMWVLFDRFGTIAGWRLPEVALLYGMANAAFIFGETFARGFDIFDHHVRNGDFDRILLRPRSTAFQLAASEVQFGRTSRLLVAAVVIAVAASSLAADWGAAELALLLASILGGACTFAGLFVLHATLSFWTIDGLEVTAMVTYGGVEATQYPVSIYDGDSRWLRYLFVYVIPLGCVGYFPALVLLDRPDALGMPSWLPWISPAIGVVFLAITLQIWRVGVRHYQSTGS